jgi:hypothetical protein
MLMLGASYRIKYRPFNYAGGPHWGHPLREAKTAKLAGLYTVNGYHHTFELPNGEQVWATANSIYPLDGADANKNSSIVGDIVGSGSDGYLQVQSILTFLEGLDIESSSCDDGILIPNSGLKNFKNLLVKMYSDILDI